MSSSRCARFINHATAIGKVVSMAGCALFSAKREEELIFNLNNAFNIPYLLAGCIVFLLANKVVNMGTRYYNMKRPTPKKKPAPLNQIIITDPNNPHAIALPPPSTPPLSRTGFIYFKMWAYIYGFYSGASGYLSAFTLGKLGGAIAHAINDEWSEKVDDAWWKIGLLNLVALYLAISSICSYQKYNYARMKEEYVPDLLQGKWGKYGWKTYAKSVPNLALGIVLAIFSNDSTAIAINESALKHLPFDLCLNATGIKIFSIIGTASALHINTLMAIPAVDRLKNKPMQWRSVPECQNIRHGIYLAIGLDSLNNGLCTVVSVSHVSHQQLNTDPRNPIVLGLGAIGGAYQFYNSVALSREGFDKEITTRLKERGLLPPPSMSVAPSLPSVPTVRVTDTKSSDIATLSAPLLGDVIEGNRHANRNSGSPDTSYDASGMIGSPSQVGVFKTKSSKGSQPPSNRCCPCRIL